MGCVYKITNVFNGKVYIGITKHTAARRWKVHLWVANNEKGPHNLLAKAIRKYGEFAFDIETIAESKSWKKLCVLEKKFICSHDCKNPGGYNLTDGGEGIVGLEWTLARRKKLSSLRMGMVFTEKHRKNLSIAHMGKPGRKWNENQRRSHSTWALELIAKDPAERKRRSDRAKKQHAEGKFGRAVWKPGTDLIVNKKVSAGMCAAWASPEKRKNMMKGLNRRKNGEGRPRANYRPETAYEA